MALKDVFLFIYKIFQPNGKAFKVPSGGDIETFNKAIIGDGVTDGSISKVWVDANNIQDVQLPDNDNFTLQDAHDWYRRLGLIDTGTILFDDIILNDEMIEFWKEMNCSFPCMNLTKIGHCTGTGILWV